MRFFFKNKNWALISILLFATILRLYKADFQNLWLDEVLTMNSANPELSFRQFYDSVMYWEFIPHLYFFLNRSLFEIFGYTTLVARLFSGAIGIMGVYALYLLGKEMFNKRAGLIAALLLTLNIYHISYSQEIRPYGLLFLFTVLSFYQLVILIKRASYKNAIYYGICTGLIINAHFFGIITVFAQSLLILYFLFLKPKEERAAFFKMILIAAGIVLLLFLPAIEPFIRVSEIKSFWMQKPDERVYTNMFREFFGSAEMLMYIIQAIVLYYIITIFRQKERQYNFNTITENKSIFSFLVLSVWLFISLTLPLIKSYLGASMMVSRYFISVIAVLILIIAIGVSLIKNRLIFTIILCGLVFFSLTDIFVAKDYYNAVRKTQYNEMAQAIKETSPDRVKIVTYYSWVLPYYFRDTPQRQVINNTLEKQVADIKAGTLPMAPFWYADFNLRPYELSVEGQKYLDDNFITVSKFAYHDIWANFYVPKSDTELGVLADGSEYVFYGEKVFVENKSYTSRNISLKKGNYKLIINGISTPNMPINGKNAHFKIKYGDTIIGSVYLSEKPNQEKEISFSCPSDRSNKIELIYDNDVYLGNQDRNATIYSVRIVKDK